MHLQDPSPQPVLLPSPWDGFEDPWAGGNSHEGPAQPAQLWLEAGDLSGHSFCWSTLGMEQPEDVSGDFRARISSPRRSGSGAGLLLHPRSRDTRHGWDGGCRSSPTAPPFPSSPNVCATYSCPWKIYGAAVSISPALY